MNIPKIHDDDKVKYIGYCRDQVKWGNNDNPDDVLARGQEYIVEQTEVHTAHTKISIKGYKGKFNSICFIKEEN